MTQHVSGMPLHRPEMTLSLDQSSKGLVRCKTAWAFRMMATTSGHSENFSYSGTQFLATSSVISRPAAYRTDSNAFTSSSIVMLLRKYKCNVSNP